MTAACAYTIAAARAYTIAAARAYTITAARAHTIRAPVFAQVQLNNFMSKIVPKVFVSTALKMRGVISNE